MKKYKPQHHWNFRVITGRYAKGKERYFSISEVYYDKNDVPTSYSDKSLMVEHTSIKDLKWVRKEIKKAFKRPILDIDNWPNEWYEGQDEIFIPKALVDISGEEYK